MKDLEKVSKVIRSWRVRSEERGVWIWFDPADEHVELFDGPGSSRPMDVSDPQACEDGQIALTLTANVG